MNNSESNMNREEHSRDQEPTKEDELEGLIKQAMLQKAGWLTRKWRRWRNTDNPSENVTWPDNIVFSLPVRSQEHAQSPEPGNIPRLPHARGTKTSPRLSTPGGQGSLQMRGSVGMGRRRGEHNTTWGTDPITRGSQTLVEKMQLTQLKIDQRCCKE